MEFEKYNVIISPAASDRMMKHFEFLAQVSKSAAERLLVALISDIRSLGQRPRRNPPYIRPYLQADKYRYLLSAKRYRIVYQIDGDTIFVDDIQDCRQNDDVNVV